MLGETELGGSVMTKKKYERILLPFERYEDEQKLPKTEAPSPPPPPPIQPATVTTAVEVAAATLPSDLTISAVSKSPASERQNLSPALEIIPIKKEKSSQQSSGIGELTREQMIEIQNMVKSRDIKVTEAPPQVTTTTNVPPVSVPLTVIVKPGLDETVSFYKICFKNLLTAVKL